MLAWLAWLAWLYTFHCRGFSNSKKLNQLLPQGAENSLPEKLTQLPKSLNIIQKKSHWYKKDEKQFKTLYFKDYKLVQT